MCVAYGVFSLYECGIGTLIAHEFGYEVVSFNLFPMGLHFVLQHVNNKIIDL